METTNYRMGRLCFSFEGHDALRDQLGHEMELLRIDSSSGEVIRFRFGSMPRWSGGVRLPRLEVADDGLRVTEAGFEYALSADGEGYEVALRSAPYSGRFRTWRRFRDPSYLSLNELRAKGFWHQLFDYLSQVAQLPLGQSYLHACSLVVGGAGVTVVGAGSIGKTGLWTELVLNSSATFLADDLSVLSEDGTVWLNPQPAHLYAGHLDEWPQIATRVFAGRSVWDRVSWAVNRWRRGDRVVRRRVLPSQVIPAQRLGSSAPLRCAFLVERSTVDDFEVAPMTAEELAGCAASFLPSELSPFAYISAQSNHCVSKGILPTVGSLVEDSAAVLTAGLKNAETCRVRMPQAANGRALAGYLKQLLVERGLPVEGTA